MNRIVRGCVWCQKFWDTLPTWVQISSTVIFLAFTAGVYFTKFNDVAAKTVEHDQRLTVLEQNYGAIHQQLGDIKDDVNFIRQRIR